MPRQPLLKRFPNAGISFGPGFLEQRPKSATVIAECVAGWTEVEIQMARLLAEMLGANTEPTVALYLSLSNERAKREALESIADYNLVGQDRALFDAIMTAKGAIASERNNLAHGLFGVVSDEADGVGWISTKDRIKHMLAIGTKNPSELADIHALKSYVWVYTLPDLQKIRADIFDLHRVIHRFVGYPRTPDGPSKTQSFQMLWNEPLVLRFRPQTASNPESGSARSW